MKHSLGNRIGVFDSGVGGLTVLRKLYRHLPQESILYFADTLRLPYGKRSPQEIIIFVREILDWMRDQDVKMVIMACNTSSALALEQVQSEYEFPILGLIHPGAKGAVKQGKRIGVISTVATAKSHAYRNAIQEINPQVNVWEVGCPEFVPLIEQNRIYDSYTKKVAQEYLAPLIENKIDGLIYGCTHYPHLQGLFTEILPPSVKLIDPADYLVKATYRELDLMNLHNHNTLLPTRFCVSGEPEDFAKISKQWLGFTPYVEKVYLPSITDISTFSEEVTLNFEDRILAKAG
ncbi:MAG: glutamate racemase [Cyanobacteria bacterium]|uniref:glutamate racemase n=1 Tax=Geminocystis sp. TaxID=2664100 RepID=UPI001D589BDF|nr:glutamate racemase [Cyanobacteria bacterium CG_2015-16_32_12]NCO79393.1 glutamate racemase [Cyanobacteria bacterium CG_2015-22_32_23]NCQ04641.1 glutamate racemase [Cyanobacteria bacterium CG_2015-09_32_10]NCQ40853.1 glutamate racemase [Cyanobacteria bacterium CG_2015-04_32_10]NCS85713.1 glutamate racemase [Cyanobacteria bacterium CG_2015-02_32_10]